MDSLSFVGPYAPSLQELADAAVDSSSGRKLYATVKVCEFTPNLAGSLTFCLQFGRYRSDDRPWWLARALLATLSDSENR